ncbi:uncharacterized protein BP01DRAFT_123196 [Aspergillus saccharolyticus JOP 1030-1]|uniref:Uncharacterized protein n=1 Tax=Aspergillus saccharolyticus JOP 1030-1 TaxID=1450539 RepID=A0A318Z6W1_9EURO|nr:hypothetical protein BP01DRAFT_123196 [Aspergillus saccharolyticus JOP 1030-1]PYH43051.1 hypothetical protein BP01DRAFT_123196 [Aspergillus saccharolyticus JOP 1030-1]
MPAQATTIDGVCNRCNQARGSRYHLSSFTIIITFQPAQHSQPTPYTHLDHLNHFQSCCDRRISFGRGGKWSSHRSDLLYRTGRSPCLACSWVFCQACSGRAAMRRISLSIFSIWGPSVWRQKAVRGSSHNPRSKMRSPGPRTKNFTWLPWIMPPKLTGACAALYLWLGHCDSRTGQSTPLKELSVRISVKCWPPQPVRTVITPYTWLVLPPKAIVPRTIVCSSHGMNPRYGGKICVSLFIQSAASEGW